MNSKMPPLPEPNIESITGHRTPIEIYYEDEVEAYGKACYQAGVDASVETLKCDEELVNAKAEIERLTAENTVLKTAYEKSCRTKAPPPPDATGSYVVTQRWV